MKYKQLKKHISAVSMIEIMMVFAIIGVITAACMSLSKPKEEYVKKIQLYSAYTNLEYVARVLVKEGSIDFANDELPCSATRTSGVCTTLTGERNASVLTKVVARCTVLGGTCTSSYLSVDPGITNTSETKTYYNKLSSEDQASFKYRQGGLCQRLSTTLNLSDANINCATSLSDSSHGTLIEDQSSYPTSFISYKPQLYLPNGQVIYLGKNLYHDCLQSKKIKINATNVTYDENSICSNCTEAIAQVTDTISSGTAQNTTSKPLMYWTNESRYKIVKKYISCTAASSVNVYAKAMRDVWENTKDYFMIYIDINGKMADSNDKTSGPDLLNKDVFAFKMYRDGAVIPDYDSGFPKNYLLGKVLYSNCDSYDHCVYTQFSDAGYIMLPINFAKCYANVMGNYASSLTSSERSGTANDPLCLCAPQYKSGMLYVPKTPLTEDDGAPCNTNQCKIQIMKPSFFVR